MPVDLGKIETPSFMLSAREDHIAPWKSTYALTQNVGGKIKFCLAASGHIAGVVNPPAAEKYGYWTNKAFPADADAWLDTAAEHPGSWWPHWMSWLNDHAGEMVPARTPGDGKLAPTKK